MSISQMISKPEYEALKEYWDFQRVIEYNKEKLLQGLRNVAKKPFAPKDVDPETMFELIWNQMKEEDYEKPTKSWVPKNEKYRFEWEPDPGAPKQLQKPTGRRVILRASREQD